MSVARSALPPPDADAAGHSARVAAHVAQSIAAAGGWIPFDRYMELVLYAPGLGYYAAGARKFGDSVSGGDFVTAPEISPLFAQALAKQVADLFRQVPSRIVEFGAGSGVLARDLIAALAAEGASVERYSIVEVSPDLAARQRSLLGGAPVEWLGTPPRSFEGVMLANEVLDVMPVKLFAKRDGATLERGVVVRDGAFAFDERPAGAPLAAAVASIEAELGTLADGHTAEVGLVGASWVRSVGEWLARGALIAIDYGFPRREYYHPHRLMGTFMCHYRHHAHADPFWLPGLCDLTSHVDFSALAEAAHDAGLDVLGYTSQARFLLNCGLLDRLHAKHDHTRANEAHRLLSEAEMGELFKALVVGRGVAGQLRGFAQGDRLHTL